MIISRKRDCMTFQELINQDKPVLVDFFTTWCGPCRMMAPVLVDVKKRVGTSATILKIDVEKNPQAAQAYQVSGVPTLIMFKNGKVLWRKSGLVSAAELEKVILETGEKK